MGHTLIVEPDLRWAVTDHDGVLVRPPQPRRLRDLPIDEVKIDKSFVQNAAHDHRDRALVRSTVELGHALELHVVAEGVEDEETYTFLARTGCDSVQGYYIAKPLTAGQFTAWLHDTTTHNRTRATVVVWTVTWAA